MTDETTESPPQWDGRPGPDWVPMGLVRAALQEVFRTKAVR